MSDQLFPVAYCHHCDDTGPVVVEAAPSEIAGETGIEIIYCPGCMNVLNFDTDMDLKFYDEKELEKATGWRLSNE